MPHTSQHKIDIAEDEYIEIIFTSWISEYNDTVIAYLAEIYLQNEDKNKMIGSASFNLYNLSFVDDPEDIIDIADSISADDYFAMDEFITHNKDDFMIGRIALLNRFYINDEYRGKGIGTYVMERFNYYWELNDVEYQALIARPIAKEISNDKGEIDKLITFYNKFEYKRIESINSNSETVLVRNNIYI